MAVDFFTNNKTVSSDRVIYTPSSFAKSSLLYLQEVGTLQAMEPHTSSRANLESYLLFCVLSGEGSLAYDGQNYALAEGDIVFVDCNKSYSHHTSDKLWSLAWCHFNGPEMAGIYEKYKSRGGKVVFKSNRTNDYLTTLTTIKAIAASDDYIKDMQINAQLAILLSLLMEDSWNPDEITEKQGNIGKIKEYLDQNYSTHITLDYLSDIFFINKFYLSELFKEQFGVSVMDYLISVRITEAKKLLRFTNQTMEDIAAAVGINGAAYFSRLFKKVEGISPNEYRRMW